MSDFKITGPGFYRHHNGGKAEVVGKEQALNPGPARWVGVLGGGEPAAWWDDGIRWGTTGPGFDLIAPWTEPKTGTVWANVYEYISPEHMAGRTFVAVYDCEKDAVGVAQDVAENLRCIARFSRNWTEGEGI